MFLLQVAIASRDRSGQFTVAGDLMVIHNQRILSIPFEYSTITLCLFVVNQVYPQLLIIMANVSLSLFLWLFISLVLPRSLSLCIKWKN